MGTLLEPLSSYKVRHTTSHHHLRLDTQRCAVQVLRIARSSKAPIQEVNKVLADVCPMGVQLEKEDYVSDHPSCIHCGKCVTEAPNSISQTIFERK
jgi:ferredoxin-like protein FixX